MSVRLATFLILALTYCAPSIEPRDAAERETIRSLTAQLNWASIRYSHFGRVEFTTESSGVAATRLVAIGRPATRDLTRLLQDPDRGVVAHIVLCRIWDSGLSGGSSESPIYLGDEIIGFSYEYRGLSWKCITSGACSADPEALSNNAHKWIARMGA